MEIIYGGTFELEQLDEGFMERCVYMHYQVSTGLGGPGGLEWITGDGTRWIVGMESVEIPEHLFLQRFPEPDALSASLWKTDDPESFQRLDGWVGRDAGLCLAVFVREAFFEAHAEDFLPFNGKTSLFGERDAVLRLLGAEDRTPMLWSETIRWMKKNTKTDLRLESTERRPI